MKKFLPHLIAILVFLVITFAYFSPLLGGKELRQSDISNWMGMSKEILDFKAATGEDTYWTNSMFGGMPAYQISATYGANLIQYVNNIVMLGLPSPANLLFLLMAGFYFLLCVLRVDNKVAILGSLAFAFSSYFILFISTGHNSKAHAIAFMAPVIAGIIMTFRGRHLLGAAITTLALALELNANHLQITYYLMMLVVLLGLFELYSAYRAKRIPAFLRSVLFLVVGAMLAVAANITNLWATQEYGQYSTRGPSELTIDKDNQTSGLDRDYITQWSYGVGESLTLLIPDFKGGASEPIQKNNREALSEVDPVFRQNVGGFGSYFGTQPFTGGPLYVGAIMILLFVLGLFIINGPVKWWLLSATILSLMLSWGNNFMGFTNLFLDYLPGYDKFRAVTTILVIAQFCIPLLGVLAVDKILKENDFFARYKKQILYSISIVTGLTLLILIMPGAFTDFYTTEEYEQVSQSVKGQPNGEQILSGFFEAVSSARKAILHQSAMRSFFLLLVASALIYTFVRYRYNRSFLIYGLIALVVIDLIPIDRRYLGNDDFVRAGSSKIPFQKSQADEMILQDKSGSFRVLNIAANTFNDASTSFYHQSIGGYHGAKLERYKELIDYSLSSELVALRSAMQSGDSTMLKTVYSQPALNMLNTKYIIYNPDAAPLVNNGALGNCWFVNDVKYVRNADEEIAAVKNFNPRTTAVIDERFKPMLNGFSSTSNVQGTIRLNDYRPNRLKYTSECAATQLAVFSEIYYDKGWKATIDGKAAEHFRVDYVLRGILIPAGRHEIEFRFEPEVVDKGEKIALAGSSLILILIAFAVYTEYTSRKKSPQS